MFCLKRRKQRASRQSLHEKSGHEGACMKHSREHRPRKRRAVCYKEIGEVW